MDFVTTKVNMETGRTRRGPPLRTWPGAGIERGPCHLSGTDAPALRSESPERYECYIFDLEILFSKDGAWEDECAGVSVFGYQLYACSKLDMYMWTVGIKETCKPTFMRLHKPRPACVQPCLFFFSFSFFFYPIMLTLLYSYLHSDKGREWTDNNPSSLFFIFVT